MSQPHPRIEKAEYILASAQHERDMFAQNMQDATANNPIKITGYDLLRQLDAKVAEAQLFVDQTMQDYQ